VLTTIAPSFATWKPSTFESLKTGTVPDSGGGYRVTTTLHPGVGVQRPAAVQFRGTVVVLIDGGSFSTTADVAAQLRALGRATFVGEETAGDYAGNTSGLNALIVLPHSKLRLKIMMYGFWNAVRPDTPGRGTRPDHVVVARVADLLQGRDAALELAQRLAQARVK
jgi:C-terminal processing protease CtpA/Prc